jgi:sorting nexin-7/30/sorting nexin-8
MDSDEEKQNYLRVNILEKGYDAEDFVAFLTTKKGEEGVNLSNWTLNELQSLVQEYILSHPKQNVQEVNNIQPQLQMPNNFQQNNNPLQNPLQTPNFNMAPNLNLDMNNNMNNNMNLNMNMGMNMGMMNMGMNQNMNMGMNNNMINPQFQGNFNPNMPYNPDPGLLNVPEESTDIYGLTNLDTILCSITEKTEMSKYDAVHIEMTMGEKVPGTLFSKAYMTYIITTSPLNLKVRRRYSDFEWLRQILLNFYSSSVIPPIPKKNKIGGDRFDETFLIKRMRNLEKFLNALMDDPVIKSSQIIFDFLSIEEDNKFNEKKKYYNNFKSPLYLRDYKSPNGKLDITLNEEREIYYQNIKDHTELNFELLTKLNKNLKLLNSEMNIVVNRMNEISKNCEELFLNSVKYCDVNEIKICYYQLNDMFKFWSTALKKQASVVNINIREYFKYTKNTFRSMKELVNLVDNYKQNYYKSKRALITKKEELFKKSDISKWDLGPNKGMSVVTLLKDKSVALPKMLCNETNAVINLKQIYGYYLNSATKEYERIRRIISFGHRHNVTENAKKEITIISELFKNITEIAVGSPKYNIKNIEKEMNHDFNNAPENQTDNNNNNNNVNNDNNGNQA